MNKDRDLVQRFLQSDRTAVPITSNPLARELAGSLLAADAMQGVAVLAFEPSDRFVQGAQVIQGGIVATMLDFAIAFAVWTQIPEGKAFSTATLTTHLLKPAAPGRYIATGRVVRMGSKLVFATADMIKDGEQALIATASSVLSVLPAA